MNGNPAPLTPSAQLRALTMAEEISATRHTTGSHRFAYPQRLIPEVPWGRIAWLALALAVAAVGAWELTVRAWGYAPSFDDTPGLWSIARDRLRTLDDPIVIVGDSRIRFDLDHEIVSEALGGRPVISLAMNGSVARPVLSLLAQDETFSGTVLCSYTPNLFWAPGGPNLAMTKEWIAKHDKRTPAACWGQWISLVPDALFAFIEKEDLALGKFLRHSLKLLNREGVRLPPAMPPYINSVRFDRREEMWSVLETDKDLQVHVQNVWKGLFGMAKPLPPDLLAKLRGEVIADARAIEARGGRVIFIRFPSTGWLREWEAETAPRAECWDPLIAESGCLGIHFEDHDELRGFDCPEWSHLTAADAVKFTEGLASILGRKASTKNE